MFSNQEKSAAVQNAVDPLDKAPAFSIAESARGDIDQAKLILQRAL